mmetsp:Transcript_36360/g.81640  ORF Transcript_36360/g.81640 Transcript_36360/m.81640 type:complete len:273 (+) Transcript_36360:1912-2730(+)
MSSASNSVARPSSPTSRSASSPKSTAKNSGSSMYACTARGKVRSGSGTPGPPSAADQPASEPANQLSDGSKVRRSLKRTSDSREDMWRGVDPIRAGPRSSRVEKLVPAEGLPLRMLEKPPAPSRPPSRDSSREADSSIVASRPASGEAVLPPPAPLPARNQPPLASAPAEDTAEGERLPRRPRRARSKRECIPTESTAAAAPPRPDPREETPLCVRGVRIAPPLLKGSSGCSDRCDSSWKRCRSAEWIRPRPSVSSEEAPPCRSASRSARSW